GADALGVGVAEQHEGVEHRLPLLAVDVELDRVRGPAEARVRVLPDVDGSSRYPDAPFGIGAHGVPRQATSAASVVSRSNRAPRKLPHSWTRPEFTRCTTVATVSVSVSAYSDTAFTSSSIVHRSTIVLTSCLTA